MKNQEKLPPSSINSCLLDFDIIVFGKGYGESILFLVGDKKYILIDSFIDNKTGNPIAVDYLHKHGMTVENIVGVICTHWDDDHTKGLSDIFNNHTNGLALCFPITFTEKVINIILDRNANGSHDKEVLKLFKLKEKKQIKIEYCTENKNILSRLNINAIIKSLTPSDAQITSFIGTNILSKEGDQKNFCRLSENDVSAVTHINFNNACFLFGGDFVNSSLNNWDNLSSLISKQEKCCLFKIPHHGSQNAFSRQAWINMCEHPVSIITRFNRSGLPMDTIVNEIGNFSSFTFVVGPKPTRNKEMENEIKKYINYKTKVMSFDIESSFVRIYKEKSKEKWCVETNGEVEGTNNKDLLASSYISFADL